MNELSESKFISRTGIFISFFTELPSFLKCLEKTVLRSLLILSYARNPSNASGLVLLRMISDLAIQLEIEILYYSSNSEK